MVVRFAMLLMGLALTSPQAVGADARSTSPSWNWGAQAFSSAFQINTTACTNIRVPIAGAPVDASATGEACPVNMVAHGYHFNQRVTQIPTTPRYVFRSGRCGERPAQGTVTHPITGESFPRTRNGRSELCGNGIRMHEWEEFSDWNYLVDRTVDPEQLYLRCCPSAN